MFRTLRRAKLSAFASVSQHSPWHFGPKTGLFLRVDYFATVTGQEGVWHVKSFQISSRKKYKTWMSLKSNILCVVCINIHCILNCFWPTLYCFRCARNPSLHAVWIIASFSTDSTGSWPLPFLPKHISFCCIFSFCFCFFGFVQAVYYNRLSWSG